LAGGEIMAGIAIEDWTGVHFKGAEIHRVISAKTGSRAYAVKAVNGTVQESALPVECLL
jgi:hypothetical protein